MAASKNVKDYELVSPLNNTFFCTQWYMLKS